MGKTYDAIVVGGGHNGLVSAAYMARAGLSVLVLEARPVLGGSCVTEEPWPGYKVSTLAYLCSLLQPKIIADLELEKHGYKIYPKDPSFFTPTPDGRSLTFYGEAGRTLAEIAKFSPKDAQAYTAYEAQLERLADVVESMLLMTPPDLPFKTLRDLATLARLGWRVRGLSAADLTAFAKIMTQSVKDFLDDRFESEALKATLATDGVIGACGAASTPGTAYTLLHHVMGAAGGKRGLWGFVRGGMGGVSLALASSARAAGAEIRVSSPVARILARGGRVRGVALADGTEIAARAVLSNAEPKRTFLKLVEPSALPADFLAEVGKIRTGGFVFKLNLALDGLPAIKSWPGSGLQPPHKTTFHICPSIDYIEAAWADAQQGICSRRPFLECTFPTVYDDSLAPAGKHIMNVFVQYAPYHLKSGHWDQEKERFADRIIDVIAEEMPDIKSRILHRQAVSPLDMEREYGLTGGNIMHGELSLDQMFFLRPIAGWARYRTPLEGLYLCGAGTHPGGGVIGASGHNCAREVLADERAGVF